MSKFSIILPVRNGGNYIKECVNSILGQSYTDFNLLVLDNCSTDGTSEWIQSLNDSRIKTFPSVKSLTIEENWGRIKEIPKNEFITLIGHDDILNKNYLAEMVALMAKHPDASLYQTHFSYIDPKGARIRDSKTMPEVESAVSFLENFLQKKIDVMGTGFMMRSADYDKLGGIPPYPNLLFADFELWISLTRISYKATSAQNCFSFRLHQSTTSISPDTKFQQSFEKFIYFLDGLQRENDEFKRIIRENAGEFLLFYCQGLSHRLLRTPKAKRNGLTVKEFVSKCKEYADKLGQGTSFRPGHVSSIRLAILLDSNPFTRSLFLGFKKIVRKPVLKK
jgi:glycosyltransferase involved in cell wall biosynthesis